MRVTTGSPHLVEAGECDVDDGAQRLGVTHGRDAPDSETRGGTNIVGARLADDRHVEDGGEHLGVNAMPAGGDDEYRLTVGEEDERTRDLADLDAEGVGRLLRSAGVVAKAPDLAACSKACEPLSDPHD